MTDAHTSDAERLPLSPRIPSHPHTLSPALPPACDVELCVHCRDVSHIVCVCGCVCLWVRVFVCVRGCMCLCVFVGACACVCLWVLVLVGACVCVSCACRCWSCVCITDIDHSPSVPVRLMSVLQCVAVCCGVLQCVAVCCGVLQCVAVCCSVL